MMMPSLLQGLITRVETLGRLRHRLVLETVKNTPDEAGGWQTDYQSLAAVWAAIRPVGAQASLSPRQTGESLTHEITVRYRTDLRVGMRFRQNEACYVIRLFADPDHKKNWLICLCTQERG
jgi:SPP1 family predicted phage head-tail adaptor